MSKLRERIESDLIKAMKNKQSLRLDTLRLLKAEIIKFELSGKTKITAEDDDIIPLISRLIKQRRESAELFRKGDRDEMALKEEEELKILQEYLPPQLSNEELEKIISETIAQFDVNDKSAMGKIMGAVMKKAKGKADGATVKSIVGKMLS